MISRNLLRQACRLSGVVVVIGLLLLPLSAMADVTSTTAGAVFLRKIDLPGPNDQTNSMSAGADSAGGMHAAFANFSADNNGDYHAYYDYCAPGHDCANTANWTLVNLMTVSSTLTIMDESQLAVDAQGHPRVVIVTSDNGSPFMDHYFFDACDSNCTSAVNWHGAEVATIATENFPFIFDGNKHFFELDPQGRPRFVLDNGVNYEYHSCNLSCLSAGNWLTLTLAGTTDTGLGFNTPALAFNSAGQPRLLAPLQDNSFHTNLNYWECDANDCATNANSWTNVALVSPISGLQAAYSSLRVTHTGAGEPRFAYYGTPGGSAESLYYYWCHSTCTSAGNWHFSSVGLVPAAGFETSGQEPDLALDSQDHPRLSFQTLDHTLGNGLGYGSCDVSCESASPNWQMVLADSNTQLNLDWNRVEAGCTGSTWIGGYRSALALDAAGNPRIGYDAQHTSTGCPGFDQDYRSARFVYFSGSTLPGPYRLYLPLVRK